MKHNATSKILHVTARAPFHIYYEGPATIVSAENPVGKFDILPGHADFFSVMVPCEVVIVNDQQVVNFKITNGITSVRDDEVMMFVNI